MADTDLKKTAEFTPETIPEFDGKKYEKFVLRKMKAKDMTAADLVSSETRKTFAVLASMAGVPIGAIEDLDADDYDRLEEVAKPLMGKSMRAMVEARGRRMEDVVEGALQGALATALADVVKA